MYLIVHTVPTVATENLLLYDYTMKILIKGIIRCAILFLLVLLIIVVISSATKRRRSYAKTFQPIVTTCRQGLPSSGNLEHIESATFRGKVVVYDETTASNGSILSFLFLDEPFTAHVPEEAGSVVFVLKSKREKIGVYVDELLGGPQWAGTDAYRIIKEISVVDIISRKVVSRTFVTAEPPAHMPPRGNEELAEKKIEKQLRSWIESRIYYEDKKMGDNRD